VVTICTTSFNIQELSIFPTVYLWVSPHVHIVDATKIMEARWISVRIICMFSIEMKVVLCCDALYTPPLTSLSRNYLSYNQTSNIISFDSHNIYTTKAPLSLSLSLYMTAEYVSELFKLVT
jgi:hypothetical protein